MRVRAARPEDFAWLEARAGCALTPRARGIRALDASGATRGVVAYDMWTPTSCQAHMAVDTPAAWRPLLRHCFHYPFQALGLQLLLGIIPAHNAKSLAMARALGFRETYRVRDGWAPGDDMVVHEMRREDCRWLTRDRT